jgi:hypothetical protein
MAKNVQNSHFYFAIIFIFNKPEAIGRTDEVKYKFRSSQLRVAARCTQL